MTNHSYDSRFRRAPHVLVALSGLLLIASGCEKLVGISDTEVTNDSSAGASSAGSSNSDAGKAGMSQAGGDIGGGPTNDAGAPGETGGTSGSSGMAGSPEPGGAAGSGTTAGAGGATAGAGGTAGKTGSGGTSGMAGAGGVSECPCSAPKPTCENGKCVVRGPTMAKATSYYIDSTEVTKAEYDVFLTAKGADTSGQVAECSWNTSYAPAGAAVDDPRPIVNVDWCDAAAYCAWADKRLCGAIGGGAVATADLNDSTKSQMYLACAGAADERYPYGGFTLKPDYCNEYFSGYMADAGKFTKCEGHYSGIFDLVGNAAEWIDSCDTAGGMDHSIDNCQLGGGSYLKDQYTCQTYFDWPRNAPADVFGFRCCSK
ncbi:MAG: SUMF1/EgtB/PvdO family nonheme iron enzyme [Polyangiaceae bacterium]